MKTALPEIPHSVTYAAEVTVSFQVPSRVAAHLAEDHGAVIIPSAGIGEARLIDHRARNWTRRGFRNSPPGRESLEAAALEGCDTTVQVSLPPAEWHLVGHLCGRLRITPGQWFAACAYYNASLEESELEKSLMELAGEV